MENLPYVELQEIKVYYPELHSEWTVSKQLIDSVGTILEREFDDIDFSNNNLGTIIYLSEVPPEYPDSAEGQIIVKTLFSVNNYKSAKWQEEPNDPDTNEPVDSNYNDFNAWTFVRSNWVCESTYIDILKESFTWAPEYTTDPNTSEQLYTGNWLLNGVSTGTKNEIYLSTGPYYLARCNADNSVYFPDSSTPALSNTSLLLYTPTLKLVKALSSLEPITVNLYGEHWTTTFEFGNTDSIDTLFHEPTTINKLQPPNKFFNDNFLPPKNIQFNKSILPRSLTTGLRT